MINTNKNDEETKSEKILSRLNREYGINNEHNYSSNAIEILL